MSKNTIRLQNMLVDAVHKLMSQPTKTVQITFNDSAVAEEFHDMLMDMVKRMNVVVMKDDPVSRLVMPDGTPATQVVKPVSLDSKRGLGEH